MKPVAFPEVNAQFGPPENLTEGHVARIPAFTAQILEGPFDGDQVVVVAWKPEADDLKRLNNGGVVFLSSIGGLFPHQMSTVFAHKVIKKGK